MFSPVCQDRFSDFRKKFAQKGARLPPGGAAGKKDRPLLAERRSFFPKKQSDDGSAPCGTVRRFSERIPPPRGSLVLALSRGLGLLLALDARLLIMLSLAKLCENAGTGGCTLEATECAVERLAFLHSDFCHLFSPPSRRLRLRSRASLTDPTGATLKLYTIFAVLSSPFSIFSVFF